MKSEILVWVAALSLFCAGAAVAGPVQVSGGLEVTGASGVDGVRFPDLTTQAEGGFIKPGDLLTSSSTRGYAMKAATPRTGTITGKALEGLTAGKGSILMLVLPL